MITEPLQILPSGRYVVIIDTNGNEAWLQEPEKGAVLQHDGTQFYWATGDADHPFYLTPERTTGPISSLLGEYAGKVFGFVNDSAIPMIPVSQGSGWELKEVNIGGLPVTGFGVAVKTDLVSNPSYISGPNGVIIFTPEGSPIVLGPGGEGDVFTIKGGQPQWNPANSGQVSTGMSATGLEGVVGTRVDSNRVNVVIPSYTLKDGTGASITVINVNVTVDLTAANGPGGLDIGGEAPSKWYYIHIISDGATVAGIISLNATTPDLTNAPGFTHTAIASLFRQDDASNIIEFTQKGREFYTAPVVWGNNIASGTVLAPVVSGVSLTTIIPPNTKSVSGNVGGSSAETVDRSMVMAGSASGLAKRMVGSRENNAVIEGFKFDSGPFHNIPIVDPADPKVYWRSNVNSTHRRIEITGYVI